MDGRIMQTRTAEESENEREGGLIRAPQSVALPGARVVASQERGRAGGWRRGAQGRRPTGGEGCGLAGAWKDGGWRRWIGVGLGKGELIRAPQGALPGVTRWIRERMI